MARSKGTILVTGANGGLGCGIISHIISTLELALYHGIYVVRDATQASALESVLSRAPSSHNYRIVSLDLASLENTRSIAQSLRTEVAEGAIPPLCGLILAAGYNDMGQQSETEEGLDVAFVANYLGHWLLTLMLLQAMDREHGRIVVVGSDSYECLAAFIDEVGLFRRKYLSLLPLVFESWVEGKGKVDPKIKQALKEDHAIIRVPILAMAEWDTVSSLWDSRLSFVRGTVPRSVKHAFMAIAIDERRWSFQPMLWTRQANSDTTRVQQCLFAGHHGDIGGGNIDTGLSTIALLWMMSRIEDISDVSFESGALLQSIVPILPRNLSTEKLSTGQPAHVLRYEGLLRSKGQVNDPPWWWSIPHKLSFGMISGDRDRCVGEAVRSGHGLGKDIQVHFTVPLLAKGAIKSHASSDGSHEVELWNGLKFPMSTPTQNEVRLWKAWSEKATEWYPDSQHGKTDEMKRWGSVLEKLGMKPIEGSGVDPVVHRVLQEMKSKSPAIHQKFSEKKENQSRLKEGESPNSNGSPKPQ
ncbi:unnamed protein product [Clonostachys solani]|uniref:T6SS Phospholipase effector Tle1-like catalytic domain-containing protein n=1 Tax=Clonostachys solani TaxID=160281 RepID=A0A9N9YXN1_9HYPO|nr:unnamed protein product [Clonostachys solani]